MPRKKYRQCLEQIRKTGTWTWHVLQKLPRQYLKHATTVSGAKGLEDPCPEHTPLVVVRDVKLDTPSFLDGLLCDRRCLYANSQHCVCYICEPVSWAQGIGRGSQIDNGTSTTHHDKSAAGKRSAVIVCSSCLTYWWLNSYKCTVRASALSAPTQFLQLRLFFVPSTTL